MSKASEVEAAVRAIETINTGDPERAHDQADSILLGMVDPKIADAYHQLVSRCAWWASA